MKIGGVEIIIDIIVDIENVINFFFRVVILWNILLKVMVNVKYFLI